MKKHLYLKLLFTIVSLLLISNAQAQIKEVLLRCNADVTLMEDHPDLNAGYDPNNEMCNIDSVGVFGGTDSPEEAWIRWDISTIEDEIGAGEEVLYVEAIFRVTWNSDAPDIAQGFRVLHLDDSFDFWQEGNGAYGGAIDNLGGLTWNKAKSINDFEDPAFHDTVYIKQKAVLLPNNEYVPLLDAVQNEFSDDGNKLLTIRVVPFFDDREDRKRWLGFLSLQSPVNDWGLETDNDGYPLYAPNLKFYIGKSQYRFSEYGKMGDISNFNVKPGEFGYWMVADDEGDTRLQLMKKTEVDQETWNPGAVAIFDEAEFQDFDLSLKAKMNYTTPSGAFFPFNDFIIPFGYEDADNFSYYAFYGNNESGAFKVIDGVRERVGDANPMPSMMDTLYHSYNIVRAGSTITVYIDDVEYHSITDDALSTKGKIGVGSHNDVVFFDDFIEANYDVSVFNSPTFELNIFPIPASDKLNISSEKNIDKYKLFDTTGRVIFSEENIRERYITLDLSGLSSGIYFLNTESNGLLNSQKVIKE